MIRGILIDLDDTLLDDAYAMRSAVLKLCLIEQVATGADPDEIASRWHAVAEVQWRRFREGDISLQQQRRERVRNFLGRALTDADAD